MRYGLAPVFLLVLMMLAGCRNNGHGNAASGTVSPPDTMSANDRAFDMMQAGKSYEEYMPVQMEAVAQLRSGHPRSDGIRILSQTGHFLMRHGDYIDALEYLQEASDSVQNRVREDRIDASMIRVHNNLASLFDRFGLFDYALEKNAMAIEVSSRCNDAYAVDLWRMRGAIYADFMKDAENKKELSDSVLHCLAMAYRLIPKMDADVRDKYLAQCDFDKAALFVEHSGLFPDSLGAAVDLLQSADGYKKIENSKRMLLGRAYVLSGRHKEGIELMEQSLGEYRRQDWKEGVEWGLRLLAMSYAQAGRGDRLVEIYPEVEVAEIDMMNQAKINSFIGADFKYRLREKQRQVDALREKNEKSEAIIILGAVILLVGLIAGGFLATTYIKLKSRSRREREAHKKEISDILSKQVMLNGRIEQLNEQLLMKENDDVIDKVIGQLNPSLLSGEDEMKFRRAFVSLHPQFLKKLRRDYPSLTPGDELLCMLIYLKIPAIDMAASLGISRPSLNSARYRLRKRLNLDKDTDLDAFVQSQ